LRLDHLLSKDDPSGRPALFGKSGIPDLRILSLLPIGSLGTTGRYGQICGISPPSFLFLPGRARAVFQAFGRMSLVARAFRRGVVVQAARGDLAQGLA
ncbi:MAG: hypothetical protein ACREDR_30780, partial [Blastocatellia bacterium]